MSDDLVNQITLNFLISKQQLHKLNKKIKQKEEDRMKTDMEIYKDQIIELFNKLVNDDLPSDLLEDVKNSYSYFIDKSIYYLKMKLETETNNNNQVLEDKNEDKNEDNDDNNEDEDEDDEYNDNKDEDEDEDEDDDEDEDKDEDEDDDEDEDKDKDKDEDKDTQIINSRVTEKPKLKNTNTNTNNVKHLPIDWFTRVSQSQRQKNYKPK